MSFFVELERSFSSSELAITILELLLANLLPRTKGLHSSLQG